MIGYILKLICALSTNISKRNVHFTFQIYEYRGASAAGDLVAGYPSDLLNADADAHHRIRTHIFYRFFKVTCFHTKWESTGKKLPYKTTGAWIKIKSRIICILNNLVKNGQ